jgi:cyclopropane-fatty-acyl-phospholipid synthase
MAPAARCGLRPDRGMSTRVEPAFGQADPIRSGDSSLPEQQGVTAEGQPDSGVHYDLPPQVFELLLDRNMNYSSGWYASGEEDLDAAQEGKMARIANYAGLTAGARVLDLGCGWCGPALYFAQRYGCHVTGVTLSPVQREYALACAARRGLSDRLAVDQRNVLDLPYADATFDQVLFLESIIHMPEKAAIFSRCARLLRPGGRVFIQESNYDRASMRERYLASRGFEEVHRAFGYSSHMVSCGEMLMLLEEAGLVPESVEDISRHYLRTLSQWLGNLDLYAERMRAVSGRGYTMLRRYLMIALATYRAGGTVCHMITARKPLR